MARVTVEDCMDKFTNRFELVLASAFRARELLAGAEVKIERDDDKNTVLALREIADNQLEPDGLREQIVHSLQISRTSDDDMGELGSTHSSRPRRFGDRHSKAAAPPPTEGDDSMSDMSEDEILTALNKLDNEADTKTITGSNNNQ